jgi:PIN domain nuclease of toxin-antitoxin system
VTAVLVDTHVLIWSAIASDRLGPSARSLLADPTNDVVVSAVSVAEIVIKQQLGKLALPVPIAQILDELAVTDLPLTARHAQRVATLPLHHRDPFDRWLVAQAIEEDLALMTTDASIRRYDLAIMDPTV